MAKKQLNTSGVDMSVFQKKGLNTEGVDMSVFDVKKKESGDEVSEPSEEPFSLDTSVDLSQYQKPVTKKRIPDDKELFLSAFSDDEKEIVSKAFDATNKYFSGMGGMTPTQKMRELDNRLKAAQAKYQPEDIASFSEEELAKLEKDYTDVVASTASELGLRINDDGTIAPYEEELQLFKQKLEDNIRLAEKESEKKAGFFENLYLKLGAGYESASANVLDLVGTITGLNYFESYKSLSEGNRYTAEKLSSLANKYDNTIENYLVNGEIGKAAGAAVSGAVESLPGMLPIFINPQYGLYVMSGMSGIDKYREVEESSIPEWEKYYNAFITGASEYAGEKLVTIPILARSKKALLSLGEKRGKQAIENAVKKTVENNASKLGRMPEWVSEGLSEVATGISTDIVDKVTINPDIEIGGQAVDNFAVGAVMGKIFALPQDVSVARNRLAARDFAKKVIDKLPADMSIDAKISLGWKIAERDALQQAEDKLDEGFKGKYQERIDKLNSEIDAAALDYAGVEREAEPVAETEVPTVGEVEPVGEMQIQLDYLKERGVEVPDGSKEADVDRLYRQERVKAIKEDNAELDAQIAEAQTRLGLETTPDVEISDDTELTLEQLDNGEPVTNEFLKKASDELYEKYNELEAMKQSDSRVYTTEQIESMQEFLGEEITKLENYAKEQAETGKFVGETETGEVTERGAEEVVEVKPKIKEDGKEMQEREGAQQGVQKPEDEVTERSEETAEAVEAAGEEAVNKPIETNKSGTNFYDPTKLEKEEFDVEIDREDVAAPQERGGGKMFERIRVWSKKKYPNKIIEGGVRNSVDVIKRNDGSVAVEYNNTIVEAKSEQDAIDMATSFLSVLDRDASAQLIKPTTAPQKPSERVSPEKGVTTPPAEKVAETAPTQAEAAKVEQGAGIKPKNVRDVYKAGREVFGLNRAQALAQAVVVDRIIGKIAKRRGVNKSKVYSEIEFRKSKLEDLSKESRNLYQVVWHGSPYAFEKFRLDKIGTGEGAQAFGWGLYFTDKKAIAEGYAQLAHDDYKDGIEIDDSELNRFKESVNETISKIYDSIDAYEKTRLRNRFGAISDSKKRIKFYSGELNGEFIFSKTKINDDFERTEQDIPSNIDIEDWIDYNNQPASEEYLKMEDSVDSLEEILNDVDMYYDAKRTVKEVNNRLRDIGKYATGLVLNEKYTKKNRNLYKVKLHGDRSIDEFNYLRWDKEVSNDVIQRIKEKDKSLGENLERWRDEGVVPASARNDNFDGKNVYKYIESYLGSPKEASLFLLDAKIDGIKYPTEITRKGTHEESFNYVIFDENVAEIEEHIKFQRGQGAKGAIQFLEDGNAIIHALTDPNVSTPLHEIAHLYEKYMSKAERDAVLKWAKHKEWTTETSEKFARGFEKYLAEGKAPNTALQKVFDRFQEWLTDIYNGITGSEIDLELNDEMRAVYSAMLGEDVVGVSMEQTRAKLERETKKAENKERLARIFDNAAKLTGTRKDIVGDERKQIRKQLIDDVIDYVKTEFELAGQALVDRVKSFVKENNLPVEDLQDNEITKSKSYAEEIGEKVKKPVQEKGTEQKEVRQVRVRDDEKDRVETKPPKEKVKERSFGKTLATAGGFFEQLQHDSPMFYVVRRSQQAIESAAAWLQERTEGQAYQELKKKHVTSISADRQDRREVFLAYLNEQLNMAVADNDLLRAEEVHEMLKTLRVVTSEEYTRAGQVVQTAAHWRSVSQDAVRWSVQHEIDRRNQKEVPYTNVTKLKESGEEVNKMSKDAGKDVTKDERVQQVINEVVNKQKGKTKQTNKEKAKVVAQKIRSFKSSNWNITLAAEPISAVGIGVLDGALELTAKTVELSGNVADAIQRGVKHIKQSEWYKELKEAQKRKIERVFAMNVRKGLGVDKFSKSELEGYLKQEVKDLGQKLNDIIREHWETKNELGVMLSERIIADLGLSEADAKLLENTVQEIINENIEKNIDEFIDPELVPKKEESRKTFIDKMGKLVMRGDLDTKLFREKFAETFGLTPDLTAQQATDIINLHKAVVETADMGIYGDVVADRFAKEVDKLIPQTKTERLLSGMVALDYANMLFGYTTWFVNIMSAAANIAIRPISETLDFVKWYNSIQTARELKSFPVFLANNPTVDGFRAWIDFAKGVTRISPHSVMDTLLSGGLREMNKYISQVESTAKLRVPELEREVHGRNRFATKLKYKGKTLVDFKYNPFNFMKFSGRFLVAQDVGMFSAFESVELAAKLRKKLLKEGFSEKEISDHINRQVTGAQLTEEQKDSVDKQLEKEGKEMSKLGIKIDLFRRNRRRMEIIREQFLELPEEDLLDAEKVAKGQIYTDTRGGVVNSIMSIIGNLSNKNIYTKLLIMPYFPFVKIFANIGDFVLDTVPAYGTLRYRGYSPSTMWAHYLANREAGMQQPKAITNAIWGKRRPTKELPFLTAQLGDKGTQARERQRQRAMFGNFVMLPAISVIAGLWAFGKDDDDEPWFDVSGARFDVKDQAQRESVPDRMPPWTIKIGEWRFRYQNKPGLMFPMAMLGFYRDMQRAGYSDEEIRDRLKLMGQAFMGSFSAMTDLQIAGGFKDLTESLDRLITTAKAYNEDPTAEDIKTRRYLENFGKYLARKTVTPFTTWLPTKNNLVQQTIQFISEERKESRSIPAILAYNTGIHHWTNRDAIDIFGKTTYSKPGFTQILYKPVLEKRDPQRWKAFEKLFEADAVPAPYWNKMEMVIKNPSARKEGEPMYEYQLPTEDEFWTLRQKSGNRFYEDILRYQDSEAWDIEKEKFSGTLTRSRTVLQDKVAKYWNDSKKQTRHYLFTWKEFEKENKDVYAKLYDNAAFPDVVTSVDIPAFDEINGTYMYVDEKGQPTILDTVTLGKDEVAELNAMAFRDYIEMLGVLHTEDDAMFKINALNLWQQVVIRNTQPFIQKYYDNME